MDTAVGIPDEEGDQTWDEVRKQRFLRFPACPTYQDSTCSRQLSKKRWQSTTSLSAIGLQGRFEVA